VDQTPIAFSFLHFFLKPNAELTGRFSVTTAAYLLVITEVPLVQRLVPEARSAEEPTGGPGTG